MGYTLCVVTSIFLTKKRMKQETFCLQFLVLLLTSQTQLNVTLFQSATSNIEEFELKCFLKICFLLQLSNTDFYEGKGKNMIQKWLSYPVNSIAQMNSNIWSSRQVVVNIFVYLFVNLVRPLQKSMWLAILLFYWKTCWCASEGKNRML